MWETSNEYVKICDPEPRGFHVTDAYVHIRDVNRRVTNAVNYKEAQMMQQLKHFDIPQLAALASPGPVKFTNPIK